MSSGMAFKPVRLSTLCVTSSFHGPNGFICVFARLELTEFLRIGDVFDFALESLKATVMSLFFHS